MWPGRSGSKPAGGAVDIVGAGSRAVVGAASVLGDWRSSSAPKKCAAALRISFARRSSRFSRSSEVSSTTHGQSQLGVVLGRQ